MFDKYLYQFNEVKNRFITSALVLMPGSSSKGETQYLPLQNSGSPSEKVEINK